VTERTSNRMFSEMIDLVPLAARHKTATLQWMNDAKMMPMLNRLRYIAPEEHDAWFSNLPTRIDLAYFAIEEIQTKSHVGNIWLHAIEPLQHAEVRIVLSPEVHGRGIGQAALAVLSHKAFEEMRLKRLYAYVLATNPRGRRAFENAGFALEKTLAADRWTGERYVDAWLLAQTAPV
jgi:RimJ/RimL family protein N-acetyltransferase